jgi:hypothetical protein
VLGLLAAAWGGDLPTGHRVGTYLMNEIVEWVRRWPTAAVNTVKLFPGQANGESKERRNRFYEKFGLTFDYKDAERIAGQSRPMLVCELKQVETWKENIKVHELPEYLAIVLCRERNISSELKFRSKACAELIAERRQAEASPMKWALKQYYDRLKLF